MTSVHPITFQRLDHLILDQLRGQFHLPEYLSVLHQRRLEGRQMTRFIIMEILAISQMSLSKAYNYREWSDLSKKLEWNQLSLVRVIYIHV